MCFPHNQQSEPSGAMEDRKFRNPIELLQSVSAESPSSVVDSTIVSILCLYIVFLETTLRHEIVSLLYGFLEHWSLCLLETITEQSEVSSDSLNLRDGFIT